MLSSCDDETEVAPVPVPVLSPSTSTSAVVVIELPATADSEAEQSNQPPVQQKQNGGGGDSSNSATTATKKHHRRRFRRCCPIVPNGGALCALDASVRRRANSEGHIQHQQRSGHSASLSISSPKQQRFLRLCKAEQNAAGAPPSPQAVRAAATAVQRAPYDDSSTDDTSRATTTTVSNRYLKCPQRGGESCGDLVPKGSDGHLAAGIANGTAEDERDLVLTINVSGMHFQTFESTLRRFPDSLLGDPLKRKELWNEQLHETFLDRSSQCFEAILHIYRSGGQVIRPAAIPVELFIDELVFYELKDDVWANFCESEGCRVRSACRKPNNKFQRKIWDLMEHPDTSPLARLIAALSVAVIIISTVSFCLESIPELKPSEMSREWSSPFFWIEFGCCLWFSIELFVRFLSFLNVLDFVAVAPFFVNLMYHNNEYSSIRSANAASSSTSSSASFAVLRIVRLVRVFRIFKLSRHFTGLQVLGKTFKASVQEFFLLIFFMGIALVLFSSGVYFAEQGEPGTKFTSIPASFWFVLATMTTVGYGDLVPHGVYGKIVGSCCALIGVLTLALPVPIIVANFKRFYRQEIILAKMYEQNPPPKQVKAIIMHARAEEESINAPILDAGPKAVTPTRTTAQFVQKISV
uniref:BTB domain-containing protein n=1 Tax=Globodera pallida TaxID=36090 RepID=A0A183C2W4_GLOPA